MKRTISAAKWLELARFYMVARAYQAVIARAEEIAKARGATCLGKCHCEIALEQLAEEARKEMQK